MKTPGKIVIVLILTVALGMAGFSVWHRRAGTRRAMEFWGPQRAMLLQRANSITLSRLAPAPPGEPSVAQERLKLDSHDFWVGPSVPILTYPGVLHLQTYLIEDRSYDWGADAKPRDDWRFLLTFSDGQDELQLAVTGDALQIQRLDSGARAATTPLAPFFLDVLSRVPPQASVGDAAVPPSP